MQFVHFVAQMYLDVIKIIWASTFERIMRKGVKIAEM